MRFGLQFQTAIAILLSEEKMKNNENIVPNVSERGNAVVITLILLLVVGAGAVFYVSQDEGMKNIRA